MGPWVGARALFPFLVAVAIVTSPFLFFPLVTGASRYDNQRLLQLLCAAVACLGVALQLASGQIPSPLVRRPVLLLWTGFFLLGLCSGAMAYSPRHAFLELTNLLLLLAASWLIAVEVCRRGALLLDRLLLVCGVGCALYILVVIGIYASVLTTGLQPPPSVFIFGFNNYRFFNHAQTISLPLLALLAARTADTGRRRFWWAITALWWSLLFLSAGRGTLLGVALGLTVAALLFPGHGRRWCLGMLGAAVSGVVVYLLAFAAVPSARGLQPFGLFFSAVDRSVEAPASGRGVLWGEAWELVLTHPWLGAGPLHFAHYSRELQAGAHPHNWLLQIASEWGLPALLLLLAALVLAFWRLWSVRRLINTSDAKNQLTLAVFMATGIAISLDGLVSGLVVVPTSQLWIALYAGCAWGWVASLPAEPTTPRSAFLSPTSRAAASLVALAAMYFLGNGLWPEIQNLAFLRQQNVQKEIYGDRAFLRPRIWHGGYF